MGSRKKWILSTVVLLGISLPAYSMVWGRLMPFSPWVIGFKYQDFEQARIYYHPGTDLSQFHGIDSLIQHVETSHGIRFQERVEIFVCASDNEQKRITGSGARFRVLPLYGRLFVSLRAQQDALEGTIHMDVYLTHELSHSLLFQNMSLWSAINCPDWLLEGLAVLTSKQMGCDGYLTRDEVREKMREGYFLHPSEFVLKPWKSSQALQDFPLPDKYWFIYSEAACFVDDLIQQRGNKTFYQFLEGILRGEDAQILFSSIYGESLDAFVETFRTHMTGEDPTGS